MEIIKNVSGETLTAEVKGILNTNTAPQLETEIKEIGAEIKRLVLDFAGLEYISSAGLRVILKIQKLMNAKGSMKLIHVSDVIQEVFEITGFVDILTIE